MNLNINKFFDISQNLKLWLRYSLGKGTVSIIFLSLFSLNILFFGLCVKSVKIGMNIFRLIVKYMHKNGRLVIILLKINIYIVIS